MRKLQNLRYLITGLVIAVLIIQFRNELFSWNNNEIDVANTNETEEYTAISLPKFQEAVQDTLDRGSPLDNDLQTMCGITELKGISYKPYTGECIIFGLCDKSKPPMDINDFVVAIKETFADEVPGVTIDPVDPGNFGGIQQVKFFGQYIGKSQAGYVLYDCDYHMKMLAGGKTPVAVPEFRSFYERIEQEYKSGLNSCNGDLSPHEDANRFWFYPKEPKFAKNGHEITLRDCGVQLLTERQMVNKAKDKIKSLKGKKNKQAEEFCKEFTQRYEEITKVQPKYQRLGSIFNLVTISKLMYHERIDLKNVDYFLRKYSVPWYETPEKVDGISMSGNLSHHTSNSAYGECVHKFTLSGGVSINVRINKSSFFRDNAKILPKLHERIYSARPSANVIAWRFKFYRLL